MKTNIAKLGLLALAVGALAPRFANAQTQINGTPASSFNDGDLVVGFYDSSNSQEYSLDLGPLSAFTLSSSFMIPNSSTDLAASLSALDSSWASDSKVVFGLIADNTAQHPTIWVSNPTGNAAWSANGTEGGAVTDLDNYGADYTNNDSATSNPFGLAQGTTASGIVTWYDEAHVGFGAFTDTGSIYGDGAISANVNGGSANFDKLADSGGSNFSETTLGSWSVDSSADLVYTAAVPEPSTIATVLFGAAALVGFRFRRRA